jgi:hypothetical protein
LKKAVSAIGSLIMIKDEENIDSNLQSLEHRHISWLDE